jgi:apyrase
MNPVLGQGPTPYRVGIRLADAVHDSKVVPKIFDEIIEASSKRVPYAQQANTRIFVYATAGMRLLSEDDQKRIMRDVFLYLREYSPFRVKPEYVRVIKGYEEGIYGWISANVLLGRFDAKDDRVAVCDMGGASLQLTFQSDAKVAEIYKVSIGSEHYNVYAHSFLGLGKDAARDAITALIPPGGDHPCMTKGYTESGEHKFHGTGDWNACYAMVKSQLLNDTFRKVEIPNMTMKELYGISTFAVFQEYVADLPIKSLADLRKESQAFASLDWNECQKFYPQAGEYLKTYFFMGVWCYAILESGFNLTDKFDYTFASDIAEVSLGWDLGALVSYAYEVYIEDSGRLSLTTIVGVSMGLLAVAFTGFVVFLLMVKRNASIQLILSM